MKKVYYWLLDGKYQQGALSCWAFQHSLDQDVTWLCTVIQVDDTLVLTEVRPEVTTVVKLDEPPALEYRYKDDIIHVPYDPSEPA